MPWAAVCVALALAMLQAGGAPSYACAVKPKSFAELVAGIGGNCSHPLCYSIYATDPAHPSRSMPPDKLAAACGSEAQIRREIGGVLQHGGIVALGEVHDNPAAHALRGELLRADILARGLRPAAVFEHLRADQQQGLDRFSQSDNQAALPAVVDDFFQAVDWGKSGWPDKKMFEPLFGAVIGAKLPIYAGDPAREAIKRAAKEGEGALSEDERRRLGLDRPLPAAAQEALLDELEKSHCGLMPKSAFGKLAYAQRYRDAHLADVVARAASQHGGAILFAGNGHVRLDRGVPHYLRDRAPQRQVLAVMLVEVEDGNNDAAAYVEHDGEGRPLADYIIFVTRAERPDPCEEMRKSYDKRSGR